MLTQKSVIAVAASTVVMFALSCVANGQDLPTKLGDITQPEATPIPLVPHKQALPVTSAEAAEGAIIWGTGREVQAGLSVRLSARGGHAGRFIFNVYLRNKTDRPLTIECPSYPGLSVPTDAGNTAEVHSDQIYCLPVMQDKHGKLVDIDVRQGTDTRRYTLVPGQVVMISHWMLRTLNNQAQNNNKKGITQVAYVSPGAFRMSCDVKAKWDGQESNLHTGHVPFDVLKADVDDTRLPTP